MTDSKNVNKKSEAQEQIEKVLMPFVEKIKKMLDTPKMKMNHSYLDEQVSPDGKERMPAGIIVHHDKLISIYIYEDKNEVKASVRYTKDLFPEAAALILKEMASIIELKNIAVFGSFYISKSGDILIGEEAEVQLYKDMFTSTIEGLTKEMEAFGDGLPAIKKEKTYLC